MKTKHSFIHIGMLLTLMFAACGESDSPNVEHEKPTPNYPTTGTVTFNQSGGDATPQNPAVAKAGKPVSITLTQTSTYKDPDGSTYTCEPKATVNLTAKADIVKAKTLKELLNISQTDSHIDAKGSNPLTWQTRQTFSVGPQTVDFDLQHQVYTHVDSHGRNIEMPYLKLMPAQHGEANSEEQTRAANPHHVAVTGIKLTPLTPQTRGTYTTSQEYLVRVAFTVTVQSANEEANSQQTLSFVVEYVGVVETLNEYPDPTMAFDFYTSPTSGTANSQSPFEMRSADTPMLIEFPQVAQYSYFDLKQLQTQLVKREPKAYTRIEMEKDTLWVETKDELTTKKLGDIVNTTNGDAPTTHAGKQTMEIGGQTLNISWAYETYPNIEVEGNDVALPYLKLEAPQLLNVQVNEKPNITKAGKTYKVYEVVATMRQEIATVNAPQSQSQSVEYIVKYTAAQEVKLVSVEYRKGYKWFEPHDNIPLTIRYVIYRVRIYSTGEIITDEFWSGASTIERFDSISNFDGRSVVSIYKSSRPTVDFYYLGGGVLSDKILRKYHICYGKMAVPDLSQLNCNIHDLEYTISVPGEWADYIGYDAKFDPDNPVEDWYTRDIGRRSWVSLFYHNDDYMLRAYTTGIRFYDRFLYIDGRLIDFLDEKMTYDHQFKVDDITMPTGEPAKVFTNEFRSKYLGRDFYCATIDTVYQYSTPPEYTEYIPAKPSLVKHSSQSIPKSIATSTSTNSNSWTVRFGGIPGRKSPSTNWQDAINAVPRDFKGPINIVPGITEVKGQ